MKIINCEQGSEEWFQCRLGKLTASDAQAIANSGKGLESLVLKKVAERLTGKIDESYRNPDIDRGHELEDMARVGYELETGNHVVEVGFCELDENVGASPDGLVGTEGLVEIKCKNDIVYLQELLNIESVDTGHIWQMQYQMWVTDRKWCDYVVFNPYFPKSIIIRRVDRNDADIKRIQDGVNYGIKMINEMLDKIMLS